jgi:hypothetical protein
LTIAVLDAPFKLAVTVTARLLVTVPAVTVKVVAVEPAATVAEAGVVSKELLSDNETVAPPVGAAAASVTVQRLLAPEVRLAGEQASEARAAAAGVRLTTAVLDAPFKLAVTVTA